MICDNNEGADAGCTLYLECGSGIAGDMLVAALLDLGGDAAERSVRRALESLPVRGYEICISHVRKSGILCCDFAVLLDQDHQNRDHDMAYLQGAPHHGPKQHACSSSEQRRHIHRHDHAHRGLADILGLINGADMTSGARALARDTFSILAEAEAKAHALPLDQVHFHEVGAVDSIVDIVSAAVLIDHLGVQSTVIPSLTDGHGSIRCQHGVIPVPVPATLNICAAHGLPLASSQIAGELVTPTGAALAAALRPLFELPARYTVRQVGIGAGKRAYERPSMLRALIIEEMPVSSTDQMGLLGCPAGARNTVTKIECDIDDSTGEVLAYAADRLREAGALEVHWIAVLGKKGRPAHQLEVICDSQAAALMERIIFSETSTIGLRSQLMERTCLERAMSSAMTPWGSVSIKCVTLPDGTQRRTPEYDDCAAIAESENIPVQSVFNTATQAAYRDGCRDEVVPVSSI
ncbi:protein of unknown function DUF111 [Coriobacterium glomerans PW2]|uniref:Pyridinium-3,5-bisthiocarboxylic acid mononucleotide nickel insertion protein n=1 Tax=Coriobacterium glomerans (strain ATCC 49209 / DSM 20642 / JCM 10262 / PW2) TaxID=700015 RepID=F2N701_CORGP|nr:nickel pincer cofactor biosynthesis protein LarC [Coriobacterium glomerans]AEB06340.1 protein of unknown function DUF111 [Coriobacterium glomerans PW2]